MNTVNNLNNNLNKIVFIKSDIASLYEGVGYFNFESYLVEGGEGYPIKVVRYPTLVNYFKVSIL